MASLEWYVRKGNDTVLVPSDSGIGFFGGSGWQCSIKTGEYNGSCFITNASGTVEGAEAINNKYYDSTGVMIWHSSTHHPIDYVPNDKTTLNLRFTHYANVDVQNAWVTACERYNSLVSPDGVTMYVAEVCHTSAVYGESTYSDSSWSQVAGTSMIKNLSDSPGESGQYSGAGTTGSDDRHDWYLMPTVQVTSGGNKYFALYAEIEYL